MGTEKRERQKAQRAAKVEAETIQARRSRNIRTGIRVAVLVGLVVAAVFAYTVIWGDGEDEEPEEEASEDVEGPDCPPAGGAETRETVFTGSPPTCIDPAATYVATVTTSRGEFEITLDAAQAPQTVNNFVFLAGWKYYQGVDFHRIKPGSVVQGGDAGEGSPGYQMGEIEGFEGEVPTEEPYYPLMSVAMANDADPASRQGDPSTNTSQFFIVVGPEGEGLPPEYSRFGQVTAGQDVVEAIAATGTEEAVPSEETLIESVTVTEQPGQTEPSDPTEPAGQTTTTAPAEPAGETTTTAAP